MVMTMTMSSPRLMPLCHQFETLNRGHGKHRRHCQLFQKIPAGDVAILLISLLFHGFNPV